MRLDEELNKLKEDIPDNDLNYKIIYEKRNIIQRKTINSKRLMYLTLALVGAVVVSTCSIFPFVNDKKIGNNYDKIAELLSDVQDNKISTKPKEYDTFVDKYNVFCQKIAEQLINNGKNNVISPYSIFSNLVLAQEVSSGKTRDEILTALDMSNELIKNNYPYFFSKHNYEITDKDYIISKENTYNSIWIQNNLNVKMDCVNRLAQIYSCYPYHINFKNSIEANNCITEYVKKNTNNLIDTNFNLSEYTKACLINVNYLHDIWGINELSKRDNQYFYNYDLSKTYTKYNITDYMNGKIVEEQEYSYFYSCTKKYKIIFILPNENVNIHDVYNCVTLNKIKNTQYILEDDENIYYTRCIFPNFKLESELLKIANVLKNKFNIVSLFDSSNSDFSSLLDEKVYFNDILHKSKLEVNEKGIEGASVTIAPTIETSIGINHKEKKKIKTDFLINKSFGVIVESLSGEIIYNGIIDNI